MLGYYFNLALRSFRRNRMLTALMERALKAKTFQKTQAVEEMVAACEELAA